MRVLTGGMHEINLEEQLQKMRADWDQRARENARYFVDTANAQWTDEEFFASGEKTLAEEILTDLGNICQGKAPGEMRVLEIGCGAGRVTRALARFFGEVHAVDVSGEMVLLAKQALKDQPNAFVYQNNGKDLTVIPDIAFDFGIGELLRPPPLLQHGNVGPSLPNQVARRLEHANQCDGALGMDGHGHGALPFFGCCNLLR